MAQEATSPVRSSQYTEFMDNLEIDPAWAPPPDPVFQYLLERCLEGAVPVYSGSVPFSSIRAFSESFHPERASDGARLVKQLLVRWVDEGNPPRMWLYERDGAFICSDDYFTLATARVLQPDVVPAWILGPPGSPVEDLQGPVPVPIVRRLLGLSW